MDLVYEKMRRLDTRGPASRGVVVDTEGAMLGPDCVLVRRTPARYRCLHPTEAAAIQKVLIGARGGDPDHLFVLSQAIAKTLNQGELTLAQIYGLRIPLAGLDGGRLRKLTAIAPLIKANFNPDEPRIPAGQPGGGEWTDDGGGGNETVPLAAPVGATAAAAAETATSIFGPLGRTALAGLSDLAAGMAAPTAFLGVLFVPTNSGLVTEGTLPDRPDLSYRYDRDTGVLDIYRQDDAGRQLLVSGHIGVDGLFHDAEGKAIGRGLGSTIIVDPDALRAPASRTGAEARAEAQAGQNRPQLCPEPTPEDFTGRKERTLAYQQQITGLPPGLEVKLNGVRFDGCREADGTMLEAKGPGYATFLDGAGGWQDWFTGAEDIEAQMQNQSGAAAGRIVEWHFAERWVADFFRAFADKNRLSYHRHLHPTGTAMASDRFKVECYWQPRPESTASCAGRLARMLGDLARVHPAFVRWNRKAKTRAAANRPAWAMPPDVDELTVVFEKGRQYKDVPREPWPEMGYRVTAWNGRDGPNGASLSVHAGTYADYSVYPNTVDLVLKPAGIDNADLINSAVLKPVLLSVVAAWEPDYGVVICWDYWQRLFGDRHWPPFRSGWMTYLAPQFASRIMPPPTAIVEPVPGGGLLLLATKERFSMDNPTHLAVADAIQAALAPLQAMLPSNPDLPLPPKPAS